MSLFGGSSSVKNVYFTFSSIIIVLLILSGCTTGASEENQNEKMSNDTNISDKYYSDFVSMYETYEENIEKFDGDFVNENNELEDMGEEGMFGDRGAIYEDVYEHEKRLEDGEEGLLNKAEDNLVTDFTTLSILKTYDSSEREMNEIFWDNHPELERENLESSSIQIEEKIIEALALDKESITAVLAEEASTAEVQEDEPQNNHGLSSERESDRETKENVSDYTTQYMSEQEFIECVEGEAYTEQECIDYDTYYASEEGQKELESTEEAGGEENESVEEEEIEASEQNFYAAYEASKQGVQEFYSEIAYYSEFTFPYDYEVYINGSGNYAVESSVDIYNEQEGETRTREYELTITPEWEFVDIYVPKDNGYFELDGSYDKAPN